LEYTLYTSVFPKFNESLLNEKDNLVLYSCMRMGWRYCSEIDISDQRWFHQRILLYTHRVFNYTYIDTSSRCLY